jgi:feruloyl-CoA synthase
MPDAGMRKPPFAKLKMPPPAVDVERRPDGSLVMRCPTPLPDYPAHLGLLLRKWASDHPDRLFLAERKPDGAWRHMAWGEARRAVDALAQALLDRGLGPDRPLLILSANSIDQAMLTLAAMCIGAPVAPVSPAYSLMSKDYAKVHHVLELVDPGMIYVEDGKPFAGVLQSLDLAGRDVVVGRSPPETVDATELVVLRKTAPTEAVEEAFARIDPDAPAKYLFTSGSTGMPKGVINTQRMMCANQAQALTCWPFLAEEPPVLVDWLPWNHTFGANFTSTRCCSAAARCTSTTAGRPPAWSRRRCATCTRSRRPPTTTCRPASTRWCRSWSVTRRSAPPSSAGCG